MPSPILPARGFTDAEFEARCAAAQKAMRSHGISVMVLNTEPEVRYFTGFLTQFWESPTRPWYLLIPATGKPVAVIPEIGEMGMRRTWLDDVRTWPAPQPEDDGLSLLIEATRELSQGKGQIGMPLGHESQLRMPGTDFLKFVAALAPQKLLDARSIMEALRFVKSEAEIEKIHYICQIASDGFEHLPAYARAGMTEREVCKLLSIDIQQRGADSVPYLIGASGPGSYDNIIMGPTDRPLDDGDLLIIDTGSRFDGYFCDFDRNFAFGHASDAAKRAYEVVFAATEAGFAAARPGARACDLYTAMWSVMEAGGALGNNVGRLGHGLGMQLTEFPSNRLGDTTILEVGSVVTLEPGMEFAPAQQMVHEENIVVREDGAAWLSRRAAPELPII